jgi:hypothetical protein
VVNVLPNPLLQPLFGVLAQRQQQHFWLEMFPHIVLIKFYLLFKHSPFFLLSFSLDEKETKNQDKKELPRTWPTLARIFVGPAHAK